MSEHDEPADDRATRRVETLLRSLTTADTERFEPPPDHVAAIIRARLSEGG